MIAVNSPRAMSTLTPSRARDLRLALAVDLVQVDDPGGDAHQVGPSGRGVGA